MTDDASAQKPEDTDSDATGSEDVESDAAGSDESRSEDAGQDVEPVGDELPEDLQPHLVDPEDYVFPNNTRRRVPGYLYLAIAAALVLLYLVRGDGVFVNRGLLGAAAILVAVGAYSIVSGWNLNVDERDALVAAIGTVGFPVGHASAQMSWRGLLSRPTWRVLLYSAEEPPDKRGFALVDGVDGTVIDSFVESNPEDWTKLSD
ncbi:MAG: hypothetical protein AAGA65_23755 [Actinomycetota bacterium]